MDLFLSLFLVFGAIVGHGLTFGLTYWTCLKLGATPYYASLLALLLHFPLTWLTRWLQTYCTRPLWSLLLSYNDKDGIRKQEMGSPSPQPVIKSIEDYILCYLMADGLIVATAAGLLNRAWRRRILIRLTNRAYRKVETDQLYWLRYHVFRFRMLLLFDSRAPWREVVGVMAAARQTCPSFTTDRFNYVTYTHPFMKLYWINGRFDEARAAALYWCQLTEANIAAYKNDAPAAFGYLCALEDYAQARRAATTAAAATKLHPPAQPKRFQGNMHLLFKFMAYRDAHIVSGILEWSRQLDDAAVCRTILELNLDQNPLGTFNAPLKPFLLKHLPVDEASYQRIVEQADTIAW